MIESDKVTEKQPEFFFTEFSGTGGAYGQEKIVIVGLGLIGGSLAKTLTARTKHSIIGIDADEKVLCRAVGCGAVSRRGGAGDLKDADFLYLCMYPRACVDFVREHGAQIGKSCIVTDTCGVKGAICPDLKKLSETYGFCFVGGHPWPEKSAAAFRKAKTACSTAQATFWCPAERRRRPWMR